MQEALNHQYPSPSESLLETETELVARAASDPQAFGRLYRIYYPKLFRYIMRTVMNVTLAEDIIAETFLKMIQAMALFKGDPGRFSSWAYRISTHCMMDDFRRRGREWLVEDLEDDTHRLVGRRLITETTPRSQLQQVE
jgi:RNA polymerase sigma factor (sigma-70 family)